MTRALVYKLVELNTLRGLYDKHANIHKGDLIAQKKLGELLLSNMIEIFFLINFNKIDQENDVESSILNDNIGLPTSNDLRELESKLSSQNEPTEEKIPEGLVTSAITAFSKVLGIGKTKRNKRKRIKKKKIKR